MRGCTCRGLTLCPWCAQLAARAGVIPPLLDSSKQLSEAAFMAAVVRLAREHGWLFYHTYSSKKSAPGYFDCTLAKAGQPLVLAELKAATGTLTIEQQQWYETVQQATGVESYIWRPADVERIRHLLSTGEA